MKSLELHDKIYSLKTFGEMVSFPLCIVQCADRSLQFANAAWFNLTKTNSNVLGHSLENCWPEVFDLPALSNPTLRSFGAQSYAIAGVPLFNHSPQPHYFDIFIKNLSLWTHHDYCCIQAIDVTDQLKDLQRQSLQKNPLARPWPI